MRSLFFLILCVTNWRHPFFIYSNGKVGLEIVLLTNRNHCCLSETSRDLSVPYNYIYGIG